MIKNIIITGAISSAFFLAPLFVAAEGGFSGTVSSNRAAGIINPIATTTNNQFSENVECADLPINLIPGSRGVSVQSLQKCLHESGLLDTIFITGFYGSVTENAVEDMQVKLGLFASNEGTGNGRGVFGPRTISALHREIGQGNSDNQATPNHIIEGPDFQNVGSGTQGSNTPTHVIEGSGFQNRGSDTPGSHTVPPTGGIMNPVATSSDNHTPLTGGIMNPVSTTSNNQFNVNSTCSDLPANVKQGSRGFGVTNLQKCLYENGLLDSNSVTGFFGSKTKSAVEQLQVKLGVFSSNDESGSGFGSFGPRTLSAFRRTENQGDTSSTPTHVIEGSGFQNRGSDTPGSHTVPPTGGIMNPVATSTDAVPKTAGLFQGSSTVINTANTILAVSTQSGNVPLTVSFTITVTAVNGQPLFINFGDGSAPFSITSAVGSGSCAFGVLCSSKLNQYSVTHTYSATGSFTAKVLSSLGSCNSNTCTPDSSTVLSSAVITTQARN